MANDNGLIDEFEKLENLKKQIEEKEKELKLKIIQLSKEKNTEILFGSNKKCMIKPYDKVIYPENKEPLIRIIKEKGLYNEFSQLNYMRLNSKIMKNEIDKEILSMVKKEKDYRLSFRDID